MHSAEGRRFSSRAATSGTIRSPDTDDGTTRYSHGAWDHGSAELVPTANTFEPSDRRRLDRVIREATHAVSSDLATLLAPSGVGVASALRDYCSFAHCATLLFPDALEGALRHFADCGMDPLPPVRSVLVRRRLCERYGLSDDACEVYITRLRISPESTADRLVEVFLFPTTDNVMNPHMVWAERRFGFENHIALEVGEPEERLLEQLMALLQRDADLLWEGGGHNPHEGPTGSTVLYFVRDRSATCTRHLFDRWELHCPGDFSSFVERHPVDVGAVQRAYSAWAGEPQWDVAQAGGLDHQRSAYGGVGPNRMFRQPSSGTVLRAETNGDRHVD